MADGRLLRAQQLHRLRIQVKKARYATDFFSSVYAGKKAAKHCKKIKSSLMQLQNCLGKLIAAAIATSIDHMICAMQPCCC